MHRAAGQAWCSEITCAGDWCHQALTSLWFYNAVGSSHWRGSPGTFCTPISTKARWSQVTLRTLWQHHLPFAPQCPLGQPGAWPRPISDLAVRHWLYPPPCVPAEGQHTPWADQQGKPPLPSRGLCQGGTLRDTSTMDRQLRPFKEYISKYLQTMPEWGLYTAHPTQALSC